MYYRNLSDSSRPNSKLVVIQAKSAPSQKLASGDLYSLCIALEKDENLEPPLYQILCTPFSWCDCPVGMFNCSRHGALLSLLFIMQQRKEWSYNEFHQMMPEPIHTVAALPIPVEIVYPRKRSVDAENEKVIKRWLLNLWEQLGLEEENHEIDDENNDDAVQNESNIQDMDNIVSSTIHVSINRHCMNNVPDVSSGMTLPVCDHVILWLSKLEKPWCTWYSTFSSS